MQPEFEDETPINPFDFWQGANFKLKIVKKDGYWNYDKSEFDKVGPVLEDDDALEGLWKKQYSLAAVTAPDQFKTYDELKVRLEYVLGKRGAKPVAQDPEVQEEEYETTPVAETRETVSSVASSSSEIEDDDTLSYFQRLAEN